MRTIADIGKERKKLWKLLDQEEGIRDKPRFKKLLAFELLFENLALLLIMPDMTQEIWDDIQELKVCYSKLGLD